jgi:perosamine synthetase
MIPQMIPLFDEAETRAVTEYMQSGGFITEFRKTEEFEALIASYVESKHAIVVNNGTVSLILMLMALDIGPGDEVIVPNYTMIATPNSVTAVGARPVFVDVERNTLCMDLNAIKQSISKNTKAIMFVSANGRYPAYDIESLHALCSERGIILLEDAAQALGSRYPSGAHIGTIGKMGSFSFSVPKIISTGQGGCIVTNDDELAGRLRRLKDFGRARGGIDIHDTIGFNFKFTDLQACVGIEQMKKLDARVIRKKEIWQRYQNGLKNNEHATLFSHQILLTAPWFIDAMVDDRDLLSEHLKEKGIGTRVMYPPINSQRAYNRDGSFPVSREVGMRGLWLPSFVQITNDEIDHVCSSINEFYNL